MFSSKGREFSQVSALNDRSKERLLSKYDPASAERGLWFATADKSPLYELPWNFVTLQDTVIYREQRLGQVYLSQCRTQIPFNSSGHGGKGKVIGQHTEGLFNLVTQCIETEKCERHDSDNKRGHETDRIDQSKGKEKAVEIGGTMQQQIVGERNRGIFDPFAAGTMKNNCSPLGRSLTIILPSYETIAAYYDFSLRHSWSLTPIGLLKEHCPEW
jgi:hypothetical protein